MNMSTRSSRKKKKPKPVLLQPSIQLASNERPFSAKRRDAVINVVAARREGDPARIAVSEKSFVTELLGESYEADDEEATASIHAAHRHLSSLQRTEALASEIYDAFSAMRRFYLSNLVWEKSFVHPFSVDEPDLHALWQLRATLDRLGVAYYVYAKAAAIYWTFDRKASCWPSILNISCVDVLLKSFEMVADQNEEMWNMPMDQVFESLQHDDVEQEA